jgi:two-component system, chemotaxis family, CheB/CheR fusion protein
MATKKRKDMGPDKAHSEKASEGQTDRPKNGESVEGGATAGEGGVEAPPMPIVAIGSSAGGLEALQEFFSNVPPDSGIAFVVVTHVRPGRDSILPELLGAVTRMVVIHAGDTTQIEPNKVIVARDSLLSVSKGALRPVKSDNKPETTYHPIDHFFRSLADDKREHAIGIILSGSGNDGSLGLKAIKAAGGMVMAQSPETAKYASMPDSAIATHLVDYVLPAKKLPEALIEYCRGPYLRLVRRVEAPSLPEDTIQAILVRLRAHSGQDFTCYKKSTMSRRIQRRMNVHHIDDPETYLSFLRENPHEVDALMEELLISVTSFFRDPAAWKALADEALPRLITERADGHQLRVWAPGCATGEEAYSVAILLQEQIRKAERTHTVQIFATDLDERAIDVARAGIYPEGISADVSPERLKAFFSREDGAYRIHKSIRDSIVFAPQNVISDPPFTRLDLIVCRNVLIYLDVGAQQTVLPNFHYALLPGGVLFLGSAESVGEAGELFDVINAKHKILRRKEVAKLAHPILPGAPIRRSAAGGVEPEDRTPRAQQQFSRRVEQFLLERFVPCSILVDDRSTIVHLQGRSGLYLEPEQGPPRNNVLEMAREGLGPSLAAGMRQARQENREIVRSDIRVRTNGGYTYVDLTILPIKEPDSLRGLLLLTLQPSAPSPAAAGKEEPTAQTGADHLELERELQRVRESLQTTVEELETSNEELKSSNEELQSTNEELQSTNEELETSKEEMQSLNEELNTVNSELVGKVDALARLNDDMNNLLNSMQVGTIFLDTKLRVKRYTDQARDVVRLISSDIGRPLSDLTSSLRYDTIEDCERVLATLIPVEKEVQDTSGRWYLVRLIPYRTAENVIEGVVMTTVDISRIKNAEESLRKSLENTKERESVLSAMIEYIPMGIIIADAPDVTIRAVSRFGLELIGRGDSEIMGVPVDQHAQRFKMYRDDGATQARGEELPLTRATQQGETIRNEVWVLGRPDGAQVPILCAAGPIRDADGRITGGVLGWQDITELRRAEEELRRSDEKYRLLFESIADGFCIIEVIFDERDAPADYRFLEMNPSFERQSDLTNARGKTMRELAPDRDERLLEAYGRVARTGQPERFESQVAQQRRWYEVYAWRYGRPQDRQVAVLFNDITARKEAELRTKPEPGSKS